MKENKGVLQQIKDADEAGELKPYKGNLTIEELENYLSALFFDRVDTTRKITLAFYCNKQGLRSSDLPLCEGCDCSYWKTFHELMKEEVNKLKNNETN